LTSDAEVVTDYNNTVMNLKNEDKHDQQLIDYRI